MKTMKRLLALLLVLAMLPVSAFASLENHNVEDVIISQSDDDANYYFPDIVMLEDGTLLVVYYRSASHKQDVGTIWAVRSTDNGKTWGEPYVIVNHPGIQSRDPNLAILPDNTVILTYFTAAGSSGTYMLMSTDGGITWGKGEGDYGLKLESDILDMRIAKRGTIAVVNNDNILVPVYGTSSGNNAYGAPATATEVNEFNSTYHRDAVMMHYQRQEDDTWELVYESMIGQEIDETAIMYTGTGNVTMGEDGYPTYDGDLYTLSREDGTLRVSHDAGRSWEVIAKEEPRWYRTSGDMMSAEHILQPRFIKLTDNCWFATYAGLQAQNYAHDRANRPVFGKVFFPEAGWYATQSKIIFNGVGMGQWDMADPATVLMADGKLLHVYYNTSTKSISGTFSELSDWLTVDENSTTTGTVDREYWSGALSSVEQAEKYFNMSTGDAGWSWANGGVTATADGKTITTKDTISGDYEVQFNFSFSGTGASGEAVRDEGLNVFPLYGSTNPNIGTTGGKVLQHRIKLSLTHGVSVHYGPNVNGDYNDVKLGMQNTANVGTHNLPSTLKVDTVYTAKIAVVGDGLYVKVWQAGTTEPNWQGEYHANTIGVEGQDYEWKFRAQFNNKGTDNEAVLVSDMQFSSIEAKQVETFNNKLTKDNAASNVTDVANTSSVVWGADSNAATFKANWTRFSIADPVPANYTFQTDVCFEQETAGGKPANGRNDNGLNLIPQYYGATTLPHYRVVLSSTRGVQLTLGTGSTAGSYGTLMTSSTALTELTLGKTYTVKYTIEGATFRLKAWEKGTAEPAGWDYEVTDATVFGKMDPGMFRLIYRNEGEGMTAKNVILTNMTFSDGETWEYDILMEDVLDNLSGNFAVAGWSVVDGGLKSSDVPAKYPYISYKETVSGDYTAQMDFSIAGTDPSDDDDRDEGIYIAPLDPTAVHTLGNAGNRYRIKLNTSSGVGLVYNNSVNSDYANTALAGKYVGSGYTNYGPTLPSSFKPGVTYTVKWQKEGSTLRIKAWEKGTAEPAWQCEYSNSNIGSASNFHIGAYYLTKAKSGSTQIDKEYAVLSNASLTQSEIMTTLNSVGFKEGTKWTFWEGYTANEYGLTEGLGLVGDWSESGYGITSDGRAASIMSTEKISGNYYSKFNFTLNGYENSESDGLFVNPLKDNSNVNCNGDYIVRLSAEDGIQLFFDRALAGIETVELPEAYIDNLGSLDVGVEYTAKIAKDYDTLSVKVWPADEAEPLGWNVVYRDESIGSMVYFEVGNYPYTYDFSRYGDHIAEGNPYQWNYQLRYVSGQNMSSVSLSEIEFSKKVTMEINHTELTVNEGETPLNVEMNTTFYPNIFAQLPTPEGCVDYTTETGNVETTALIHPAGVRIQRANVTGVSAGEDTITASYPNLVDAEGNQVKVSCAVTVKPANSSTEFLGIEDGYVPEIIYAEDFEEMELNTNRVDQPGKSPDFVAADKNFNALSEFFEYRPFYSMSHMGVLEDEETANRYLQTYLSSANANAGVSFLSTEKIEGDYTFQAEVYLPTTAAQFRVNVASQQTWVMPDGESCYVLKSGLSGAEKLEYVDYMFIFKQWSTMGSMQSEGTIYIYDEAERAAGWQIVKAMKAGDTVYFKSWAKGTPEPDWEVIITDEKLAKTEAELGSYLTIQTKSGYTGSMVYDEEAGSVLIDNIRITRQVEAGADTVISDVTLDLGGATLAEGKELTKYAEGTIVDLPVADDMVKDGYVFEGWYDNADFRGEPVTEISADATGDLTFYAKWVEEEEDYDTSFVPDKPESPIKNFTDVKTLDWFHEAVEYAVVNGLMTGISETEFAPHSTLNRAMVVTVLWRMEGEPKVSRDMTFTDVPAGQWYTEAIRWAASEGIVNGIDAQTYAPLNPVTREQLVTILYRYAQKKGYDVSVGEDTNILSYADAFSISEYAIPAMQWACGAGVINGNDDGSLNPKGNTKRSEFAKVIMNFCENVAE